MVTLRDIEKPFQVKVSREFAAPVERVFDAWIDPNGVGKWLFGTPDGKNKVSEVDPRVGGDFRIGEERDGQMAYHVGTYHTIDRHSQIVFSYFMETVNDDLPSNVIIDFVENGEGCVVTVTHVMDDIWAEHKQSAIDGWNMIFNGLGNYLGG